MSFMNRMNEASTQGDTEFTPLPEGTYTARLTNVETEPHPDDGIMRTSLEFTITHGEHNGRRVWDKIKHADTILWKAGAIFNGMGIKGDLEGWGDWALAVGEQAKRGTILGWASEYWVLTQAFAALAGLSSSTMVAWLSASRLASFARRSLSIRSLSGRTTKLGAGSLARNCVTSVHLITLSSLP